MACRIAVDFGAVRLSTVKPAAMIVPLPRKVAASCRDWTQCRDVPGAGGDGAPHPNRTGKKLTPRGAWRLQCQPCTPSPQKAAGVALRAVLSGIGPVPHGSN